jgi:hypothetical protein
VVPDVTGDQWPAAVEQQTKAGLKPTVVARRDDVLKRYQVIGTDPAPGTAFESGDAVNVFVSTGPTPWFDFAAGAKEASWTDAGGGDAGESFDVKDTAVLPPGGQRLGPALQMDPTTPDGSVTGEFTLPGPIEAGDRFRATVGLREGAGDARVRFSAQAVAGGEPKELTKLCEVGTGEPACTFDVPLSDVAGATQIRLRATNLGSGENAFAVWLDPRIVRP